MTFVLFSLPGCASSYNIKLKIVNSDVDIALQTFRYMLLSPGCGLQNILISQGAKNTKPDFEFDSIKKLVEFYYP